MIEYDDIEEATDIVMKMSAASGQFPDRDKVKADLLKRRDIQSAALEAVGDAGFALGIAGLFMAIDAMMANVADESRDDAMELILHHTNVVATHNGFINVDEERTYQ